MNEDFKKKDGSRWDSSGQLDEDKSISTENQYIEKVNRLINKIKSIHEFDQKCWLLKQFLTVEGEYAFERLIYLVIDGVKSGNQMFFSEMVVVLGGVVSDLPGDVKVKLLDIAWRQDHRAVVGFLQCPTQSPQHEGIEKVRLLKGKDGKPLTLGERKFLARNPHRYILTKLLHDPSPEVIENLLKSPKITETDVIRIASLRPTTPKVLRCVFRSKRWINSYRVKLSLVLNPYFPPELGIKLIPSLLKQDVEKIAQDPLIHPEVRRHASEFLCRNEGEKNRSADGDYLLEFSIQEHQKEELESDGEGGEGGGRKVKEKGENIN